MKAIRLLAFRGIGSNPDYADETDLILVGHVGIQLEGDPVIYGFHPTVEAMAAIGDREAVLEWLRDRKSLAGAIFDDTDIFKRAWELATRHETRTTVYVMEFQFDDRKFDTIREKLLAWFKSREAFDYGWPPRGAEPMPSERENCATFPRKLQIPIPEPTGQIRLYVERMEDIGTRWNPEE